MRNQYCKLLFSVTGCFLFLLPLYSQTKDYNYSVKDRWTLKTGVASYKTAYCGDVIAYVGDNFSGTIAKRMVNFKVEANYGINRFIEIGLFTGFQHYEWIEDYTSGFLGDDKNKSLAPLFGVNANFHILPFFVKSKNCHWDLYLTTKYGGCYLPHKEIDQPDYPYRKYRHEYGLGLGIAYYFKNIIGLYAEGSVGQYYLFRKLVIGEASIDLNNIGEETPLVFVFRDLSDSNFSFRIGVAVKF